MSVIDAPSATEAADLSTTALALARRFAAGATLWCAAPGAPHHARHVAVEFVHPVIMGTRSLPARALVAARDGADLVDEARLLVRPGDVVLVVGRADQPAVADLLRRGEPWGVRTVLLATGPRPDRRTADHVVWVGDGDEDEDDGTVLAYHLLWELTHVVFEHPGLLAEPVVAPGAAGLDDVCITCADEGRVVEVRAVADGRTAVVQAAGHEERVDTSVVDPVVRGDLLLVHAGLALSILPPRPEGVAP